MNQFFSSVSKRNSIEEEINKLGSQLIDEATVKMKNETEELISNHLKTRKHWQIFDSWQIC